MNGLFSFSGRLGRSAYWKMTIAGALFFGAFIAWQLTLDPWQQPQVYTTYSGETTFYWGPTSTRLIYGFFALGWLTLSLVGLSVSVRRWHDLNKSGWWVLIGLVPIFGGAYSFIMQGFVRGAEGPNQYGPGSAGATANSASQRVARPRHPLQALPLAAVLSLVGGAITLSALLDLIAPHVFRLRNYGDYNYGYLVLILLGAMLAWFAASYHGDAFIGRYGLRRVSIIADSAIGIGLIIFGVWITSSLLLLVFAVIGMFLRISALSAYRSVAPEIAERVGTPLNRVQALFDAFPYAALLVVPFLSGSGPLPYWLWRMKIDHVEWAYAAFFTTSALVVAFMIPRHALPEGAAGDAASSATPFQTTGGPIEEAVR